MTQNPHSENEIREAIAQWSDALMRQDVDAMLKDYDPDVVLYDVAGLYTGVKAIRDLWMACFPKMPKAFKLHYDQMVVYAGDDTALMHALASFRSEIEPDHPACKGPVRVTVAYRKKAGIWHVVHEHVSVPMMVSDCTV